MTTSHNITAIEGQTYLIPLRLLDTDGQPAPLAAYDIYGAVRTGGTPAPMAVEQADASACLLSIPPMQEGAYAYDLFARHRTTGAEVRLLRGTLTAQRRTAALPPATGAGEEIAVTLSADTTVLTVTVSPIVASTPGAVEALATANALLAASMQQAADLVPAAREAVADAGADASALVQKSAAAGVADIRLATGDGTADLANVTRSGESAIAAAAIRETGTAAAAIAATGEQAKADIHAAAVRDAAAALDLIDAATAKGIDSLDQSIISGTDTLNAATASGKQQIAAAVTSGTGTINQTVTNGMDLLDGYVGTTADDLARYSKGGQWSGVQTFNAAAILNGGGIVSTSTPLTADPLTDQQRITGLLDGQQLQALYGGRPLPVTYETHATDATRDLTKWQGMAYMQARASQAGAWQCAWLTSQQPIAGSMYIRANATTGGQRRVMARPGVYALSTLPLATCMDAADTHPPIAVGLNVFFTGHSAGDNLPPLRWPWQPQIFPQPHHANWNQPKAIVCCEAYGHRIPSILVYVGYGGSVTDKDVTPSAIRYNCIPCVRYKSPIADVSTITTIYFSAASNSESYYGSTNLAPTYIQTSDGQLVAVPGTPLDHRNGSVGILAISKAGTQASACIRDIVHYPNILPASRYATASVAMGNPVHPIETRLKTTATHTLTVPKYGGLKMQDKISISYNQAAPEEYPYEYTGGNIVGGTIQEAPYGNYGKTLTISAAAQDMQITCPAGWIIDVDDWAADWCAAEGNTLRIQPNPTAAARYASVWIYAPNNTNNGTDATHLIYEYIIRQQA